MSIRAARHRRDRLLIRMPRYMQSTEAWRRLDDPARARAQQVYTRLSGLLRAAGWWEALAFVGVAPGRDVYTVSQIMPGDVIDETTWQEIYTDITGQPDPGMEDPIIEVSVANWRCALPHLMPRDYITRPVPG